MSERLVHRDSFLCPYCHQLLTLERSLPFRKLQPTQLGAQACLQAAQAGPAALAPPVCEAVASHIQAAPVPPWGFPK